MMKSITIANQKGGAGKTTLAINLALAALDAGYATLLIDADPQVSASFWADRRPTETRLSLDVVAVPALRVPQAIERARTAHADLVIVDTAPHAEQSALSIAAATDGIVVPVQPSILDLEALRSTAQMIALARKPAIAVGNAVPTGGKRRFEDLRDALTAMGIPVAPVWLSQRAAHRSALADRKGVIEFEPAGQAAREVEKVFEHLAGWLQLTKKEPSDAAA